MKNPNEFVCGTAVTQRPFIPEGEYIGNVINVECVYFRGRKKYQIFFKVNESELPICHFYNWHSVYGANSKLYRDWAIAMDKIPSSGEIIDPHDLISKNFRISVRTVSKNGDDEKLPLQLHYSVVDKIISLEPRT